MKDSIHKYFKVGLIPFMAYPSIIRGEAPEIPEIIKKVVTDDYFDAVEITWIKDDKQREQVAKMLECSHMTVCYGAQPRLLTTKMNPNDIDEEKRMTAEKNLIEGIDEAKQLGAKGIAFLAGKWEEETKEQAYGQLIKTTEHLCEYAKAKDMFIEMEVFDYDIDKAALIGPAPYAAKYAADIRCKYDNFGLLVDLSHFPICRETTEFAIRVMKPYITHLHIGNAVVTGKSDEAYGDEHPRFGFPESANDTAEVLEFLRVIKKEGFFNKHDPMVLSFEVKPWKNEDGDIVVANAKRVLNRAWALLED